ncbi:MAG TPA: beta-propeller fold lactonase family protein [Terracidiphilus sp.]|jgi:6-phosphogluconolactonase (cycloisomerase 2 family)|nr:beta-propeller fold lactonase family protein [Terracidiphilus sp.]
MKFRKFGKALLMSAISAGAILSVTSCVQSYTVGFLYVTGTQTAGTTSQGVINGFKIDHNTGYLTSVNGMPISSGGANPGRAVLVGGSRFFYVLNRGADSAGGANCTSATTPCTGSNITLFSVGSNGALSAQPQQFYSQGLNPFRILADSQGNYIYVLDHDAPDSGNGAASNSCTLALGPAAKTCGDITAFKIDQTTGRLSLQINAQVSTASGQPLAYFPVPSNPIDMQISHSFMLVLSGTPAAGDVLFPYSYSGSNGQLTISQNGAQPLNIFQGTALSSGSSYVYVMDNEPLTANGITSPSQIIPFSVGTGGALQAQTGGAVADDPTQSNPLFLLQESKGKWVYVANTGDNQSQSNTQSGITGYVIDTSTQQLTTMPGSPFGTGAGPQCLVEDPSNQFIYTANFNSSSVTGSSLDENSGVLRPLPGKANRSFSLSGPAAYCVINGRTS